MQTIGWISKTFIHTLNVSSINIDVDSLKIAFCAAYMEKNTLMVARKKSRVLDLVVRKCFMLFRRRRSITLCNEVRFSDSSGNRMSLSSTALLNYAFSEWRRLLTSQKGLHTNQGFSLLPDLHVRWRNDAFQAVPHDAVRLQVERALNHPSSPRQTSTASHFPSHFEIIPALQLAHWPGAKCRLANVQWIWDMKRRGESLLCNTAG